jgi:hypothetical protein
MWPVNGGLVDVGCGAWAHACPVQPSVRGGETNAIAAWNTRPQSLNTQGSGEGVWLDIESAPRDGTLILGYGEMAGECSGPTGQEEAAVIQWTGGRTDYLGYDWAAPNSMTYAAWMQPTHWMPLPLAPPSSIGG